MRFLLTGEGHQAYELWATELSRQGRWAAPFEPRADEDDGPPRRAERGDRAKPEASEDRNDDAGPPQKSERRRSRSRRRKRPEA